MKNLKRLLCLLLCLITVTCCGCLESCLNCMIEDMYERHRRENIELNKIAAGFVPEVTGYELTVKEVDDFSSEEEYRNQGYFTMDDMHKASIIEGYFGWLDEKGNLIDEVPENMVRIDPLNFEVVTSEGEQLIFSKYITVKQESILSYEFFGKITPSCIIYFDNNIFLIFVGRDRMSYNPPVAAALYLVDFENEKLLYCDYAEERYLEDFSSKAKDLYKIIKTA